MSVIVQKDTLEDDSRWKFTRKDGSFIEMPLESQADIVRVGTNRRYNVADRFRQDGGEIEGDGTYKKRVATLTFNLSSTEDTAVRQSMNTFEAFFRESERPFYLYDKTFNIRTKIILPKASVRTRADNRTVEISYNIEMPNALWEDDTESSNNQNGLGLFSTFSIDNTGEFDAFPIFTFTAVSDTPVFTLENTTLEGGFQISSLSIKAGSVVVFDMVDGPITIDGVESSVTVQKGGPIKLLPGVNEFAFSATAGTMDLVTKWRRRYAY